MKTLISALMLTAATSSGAAERVTNGSFEAGNTGFTTSLAYVAPSRNVPGKSGTYSIGSVAGVADHAYGHENGMGNYMIGNGSTKANAIVWQASGIKVTAGTEYIFDNWFATLSTTNRPKFQAFVNFNDGEGDRYLGTWVAERGVGVWQGMEARFVPTGNTIDVSLRNVTASDEGNDFALDAVRVVTQPEWAAGQPGGGAGSAGPLPEPTTWAMMVTGFMTVGLGFRRRRAIAA